MNTAGLNLLIPDKPDLERDALASSFAKCGGAVHRIGRFWDPPVFDASTVRVCGADSFCLVLQQKLGLTLCSPEDELLLRVPSKFLSRRVIRCTLGEVLLFPAFVKPIVPKQFRGAVYRTIEELAAECAGLLPAVILSEPVALAAEARTFVMEGRVLDCAVYEGEGKASEAEAFVSALTHEMALRRTVVIDVGLIAGRGWD